MSEEEHSMGTNVMVQFISEAGEETGALIQMTSTVTTNDLTVALKSFLPESEADESSRFLFFVEDQLIADSLRAVLDATGHTGAEAVVRVRYQPEAQFRVRPVERCTASLEGHSEAIVALRFAPDSTTLATASGDTTVRLWDRDTQTPLHTCRGHRNYVLCVEWSPDGRRLASACKDGDIHVWDPRTGKRLNNRAMNRHKKWINALAWKPLHLDGECRFLASASKDFSAIVWDTVLCQPLFALTSHTMSVTCVRWGGADLIYTCSQDRDVHVWRGGDGSHVRVLRKHAHWVNWLALSTDYLLRTGAHYPAAVAAARQAAKGVRKEIAVDETEEEKEKPEALRKRALNIFQSVTAGLPERMVSCSDDHTMILWRPESDCQPVARLTGHMQTVIDVKFSPDGRWIASASFDKSIKLWNGVSGAFIATLRGHVHRAYQLAWSGDSRLLVSGSADSTLKLWDLRACLDPQRRTGARGDGRKPMGDLPGHRDEVYAVDWSPDGRVVASGGKDRVLKLWQH